MTEKTTVLKLAQVTKKFRRFAAVSKVSFAVEQGEVVGFV
ncbi:ABC transporter, partial [Candidatus Saccharibacteria bacterium]|nr:ABC transporter [Candidatus Saccharibacteria bacterium]